METSYSTKAHIELFHLAFLEQLSQKLDKRLYALKGGCNLRFFLSSIRYSEDIDIDVHTVAPNTLKNTVNKILSGVPFAQILRARNISIAGFSTPKQTATTQRWKILLNVPKQALPINTKIEFSRRDGALQAITEPMARELTMTYKIRPIFISHYDAKTALQQKIKALILRNETQARDIFDIHHLIHTHEIKIVNIFTRDELQTAIDNAMCMSFSAFKSQVVSYLEPGYQSQYDDSETWDTILISVCEYIREYFS